MNDHPNRFRSNVDELLNDGFTVIDTGLSEDDLHALNEVISDSAIIARQHFGADANRLQSIVKYGLDPSPVEKALSSPAVTEFVHAISPDHYIGGVRGDMMLDVSCMFEPLENTRCTYWHRDWRDRAVLTDEKFEYVITQVRGFVGYTLAVAEDSCFWYVPGSHKRHDANNEATFRQYGKRNLHWDQELQEAYSQSSGFESFEDFVRAYVTSMDGAKHLILKPGEMVFFNHVGWHIGHYDKTVPRRSILGTVGSPFFEKWTTDQNYERHTELRNYGIDWSKTS